MTGARIGSHGYDVMVEDKSDRKNRVKEENLRACGIRIGSLFPCSNQNVNLLEWILAIYKEYLDLAHLLWELTEPIIVLKIESVTCLLQTKAISPSLWKE